MDSQTLYGIVAGAIVTLVVGIIGWLISIRKNQNQNAGDDSIQYQAGSNIEIGKLKDE